MLRRNGLVMKSVESVLRLEGSLWGETFVEKVGLEPGVKETGSYGWTVSQSLQHVYAPSPTQGLHRMPPNSLGG